MFSAFLCAGLLTKTMPVKTDLSYARAIAQVIRVGWYCPVHIKSPVSQELRMLLANRKKPPRNNTTVASVTKPMRRALFTYRPSHPMPLLRKWPFITAEAYSRI